MTPEEKAVELFNKMYNVDAYDDYNDPAMQYGHAKKCTLIAVDEIINSKHGWNKYTSAFVKYWQQVKQEINNL